MTITFPGESAEYRAARDRLLEQEIELRRVTEAVAAARRQLPPGGAVPQDCVFQGRGADGTATDVRLSELFAAGKNSLVIYSFMFPRAPNDERPGPKAGQTALLSSSRARARRARHSSISSMAPRNTSASGSTSRSWRRLRYRASLPLHTSVAGGGFGSCPRPATTTTVTT
jgi:predicted dithiol-disulfide oxidoreductase (DUF899 family)